VVQFDPPVIPQDTAGTTLTTDDLVEVRLTVRWTSGTATHSILMTTYLPNPQGSTNASQTSTGAAP